MITILAAFSVRDFPFNYPALAGGMMMRCVPSNVRYDYMNALYKLQKSWVMREHKDTRSELYKIMQSGGMQQEDFDAHLVSDEDIEVYFSAELVMMVKIANSTLTIEPVTESCFDAVLMVLRFVSERHEDIMKEFKKLNTIETPVDVDEDEDSEDDLMSEMFGLSCNMTIEDAVESDEETDFSDTLSKNITKLQ